MIVTLWQGGLRGRSQQLAGVIVTNRLDGSVPFATSQRVEFLKCVSNKLILGNICEATFADHWTSTYIKARGWDTDP